MTDKKKTAKDTKNAVCDSKGCHKSKIAIILAIVAVGAGGYYTSKTMNKDKTSSSETSEVALSEVNTDPSKNIVIARVNKQDISIGDVEVFVNKVPQLQGQPIENVFPIVQEQLVSSRVVSNLADNANIGSDPEVAKRLEMAKIEIIRMVFVEKEIDKIVTEAKLQASYKDFLSKQPEVKEASARHILVEKEDEAKAIIKQLTDGADFAELAKEKSTGPTGAKGGDLGYFAEGQMVPEFSEAAFALETGEFTKEPVKTQFGYHIIKLEDKRMRPAVPYEEAKGFLEAQEKKTALNDLLAKWKEDADIEIFDIKGNDIEPASGE